MKDLWCRVWCYTIFGLGLFALSFSLIYKAKQEATESCGIDVWLWLLVHVSLVFLGCGFFIPVLCYAKNNNPLKGAICFYLVACLWTGAISAHCVYGWIIWDSEQNDCREVEETE